MHRVPRFYNMDLPEREESNGGICEDCDYRENEVDYGCRSPL